MLYEIVIACVVFVMYVCCKKTQKSMCCIAVLYFSASGIFVLYFYVCGISCYIFTHSGILCCIFRVWNFVSYFYACVTRSGIVEFCVIFFSMWNAIWYCEISCYIFLRVKGALVLWNLVLYFYACGTHSCIVEFSVAFFCVWNALWYCGL